MDWRIIHRERTESTNADARTGVHGDVFTAGWQSAGRGRLDHKWLSPPGANLLMSAVLDVAALAPEEAATFPLAVGLAVADAVGQFAPPTEQPMLKWPNDVLLCGRKLAGILCERHGNNVIAGIGVNVLEQEFPPEIAERACCLGGAATVEAVRDAVLFSLAAVYERWTGDGFASILEEIERIDFLKDRRVRVVQVDGGEGIDGICRGIARDGALYVGGAKVYAGEVHVETMEAKR